MVANYSLIDNGRVTQGTNTSCVDMENGMRTSYKPDSSLPPVGDIELGREEEWSITENGTSPTKGPNRLRTVSVSTAVQTHHANTSRPKLHIPGETGELNDMSTEIATQLAQDNESSVGSDDVKFSPEERAKQMERKNKMKALKFKLILFTSVVSMIMLAYCTVEFPWFLAYYHTIVFPILYLLRIVVYHKRHWQLYCLDFCYFGNIALLVFCWAFPQSESFFAVTFGAIMGPMAVAVLIFRNSIVFHDYDRMTSAYIHLIPVTLVYLIRWYPEKCSKYWYYSIYDSKTLLGHTIYTNESIRQTDYLKIYDWVDARWIWIVVVPFAWFILHTILFLLIESTFYSDKKYLTSYRWLTHATGSAVYNILTLGGRVTQPAKVKILWILFNALYALLSILSARLFYEFYIAHSIYVVILYSLAIYNGASFYIEVFAKRGLSVVNG